MTKNYSISEIENFWKKQSKTIPWFKECDKVLDWQLPQAKWFINGELNASYVCLDQHIKTETKNKIAIYWENENGEQKTYTYFELYEEVNKFAYSLKQNGMQKGDRVILYLPMIPQAVIAMLAVARLGAIHSVVFSGFSSQSIKERILDTQAKFVITADFTLRRGKHILLKKIVDEAVKNTPCVKNVITIQRSAENSTKNERDLFYHELIKNSQNYIEPEKVESNHPLFILYTSGTTGKPKGIMHSTGGYLTYVNNTFKWAFDVKKDSIYWCTADIGWITGHSFLVYAPLSHGTTIVMHEGSPDFPTPEIWWQLIEKYKVSIFYTSPTALRMLMRFGNDFSSKYDLSSLKILGTVGEPINPEVWDWYNKFVGKQNCPIIDTWWQTETGGFMISPTAEKDTVSLKPGSATFAMPYIEADVVDEQGNSVPAQTKGYLVIKKPWPGMTQGLYNNQEKFKEIYWSKFEGCYYSGDYAKKDKDGYFWLLGRADEVINIAGHRIGTAEIESATIKTENITEAAAISIKDDIKGEAIVVFASLKEGAFVTQEIKNKILQNIKQEIGSFAKPKEIYLVKKLPKTRSGKIMRRILKAILEDKSIGDITTLEDETSVSEIKAIKTQCLPLG